MANPPSDRTRLRRIPDRGHHDPATIHAIVDEAYYCHLGFTDREGRPVVLPTVHARIDNDLYVHGSAASHMLKQAGGGIPVCITVTLLDGLVLARSGFHHSMNYRSVVAFGTAEVVEDEQEKRRVLDALVDHVVPGRSRDCRAPNETEMMQTKVLRLSLTEASAKIRTGPPVDDEEDMELPHWAGVLPLSLEASPPVADADSRAALPSYLEDVRRPRK